MDRRKFLCNVAAGTATAGAATISAPPPAKENAKVEWKVNGFTCITCAVGLEVMMKGLKGVARVKATWPDNTVSVGYDRNLTNEKNLRDFIAACGFAVV